MKIIPTTIITGFLGSGKTTILNNVVKNIWDKEKVAIIKNEISDVGVDAIELTNPKLTVTELPNGCICCTLVGALNESIEEIIKKYNPDRLFIEASGFAKPGQIAIGLELIKNINIDGIIIVYDAVNYSRLKEIEKSNAAKATSELVDLYIINKANLASENQIDEIKDDIYGNFPSARIIETENAEIPAELIIGIHPEFIEYEMESHDHTYSGFESFSINGIEISEIIEFKETLEKLPRTIYRIKGYFKSKDKNYILNGVAGKIEICETKKDIPSESKIVFIGQNINKYEKSIVNLLSNKKG